MDMHYPYQLPPLPYAYEALSPNISGDTFALLYSTPGLPAN